MKKGLNLRMGLMMALNGSGSSAYDLGPVDHLPVLGADDEGATAYDKGLKVPVYFDGQDWKSMVDGTVVTPNYLTFTAKEDGAKVGFCCWSEFYEPVEMGKNMQYSLNGGMTWSNYRIGIGESDVMLIALRNGESVMFCGNNYSMSLLLEAEQDYIYTKCVATGRLDASGDVTSLLNGRGGNVAAVTLSFGYMFYECESLETAPSLASVDLSQDCYDYMFSGCSGIVSHHITSINDSINVFDNNSSCASLTIDAAVPPTIANSTITGLKADCAILVPAASVAAYKAAQYWSDRADYIQAKP